MAVTSRASAVWHGTLKDGNGSYRAGTKTFSGAYTAATRFEGKEGTNPEELLAAAHAACFSMALAAALAKAGHTPERIETTAKATMDTVDGKPTVKRMDLVTRGTVPGASAQAFKEAAEGAKVGCPVSRALAGIAEVTLDAALA